MKKYHAPEIEMIKYKPEDVLTTSDKDNNHVDDINSLFNENKPNNP